MRNSSGQWHQLLPHQAPGSKSNIHSKSELRERLFWPGWRSSRSWSGAAGSMLCSRLPSCSHTQTTRVPYSVFPIPCSPSRVPIPCSQSRVLHPMFPILCSHPVFSIPCCPSHVLYSMFPTPRSPSCVPIPCSPSHVPHPMFSIPCSHPLLPSRVPHSMFPPRVPIPCSPSPVPIPAREHCSRKLMLLSSWLETTKTFLCCCQLRYSGYSVT